VTIEAEHRLLEEISGGFVDVSHPALRPAEPPQLRCRWPGDVRPGSAAVPPHQEISIGRLSRWAFRLRDGCLSRLSVRERLGRGVAAVVTRLR